MRRALLTITAFLALVPTISGCEKEPDVRPTITSKQAVQQVGDLVQEVHRQLPAGTTLKLLSSLDALPCDDPTDGGPAGRVFVEQRYQVVYPTSWPIDQALPTLAERWQQQGWKTVRDGRDHPDPSLVVERPEDGFHMGIDVFPRQSGVTDIYLTGSSTCVWENGTPEPRP